MGFSEVLGLAVRAVFVDAAGTLLRPREPVGVTYARAARLRGHRCDPVEVEGRFRDAWRARQHQSQAGDGRAFWAPLVAEAVGVEDDALFEALYDWYSRPRAWWVDTEALRVLGDLSRAGIRIAILSNWDLRLRELFHRFALDRLFSALVVSAEHGVDKPDPRIFEIACRVVGVAPREAIHVGDDAEKDVAGASHAGLVGLQYDDDRGWRGIEAEIARLRRSSGIYARS